MTLKTVASAVFFLALLAALASVPFFAGEYAVTLMIGMTGYVVLATAWGLFSGPTRYVSLATVAFFGIGAYTVSVLSEVLPYILVLVAAGLVGLAVALVVGLATLRLAGVYFVIFSFGLAELVRQLVTWYEVNITGTLGRYIFLPVTPEGIYWQLLALAAATLLFSWAIGRRKPDFVGKRSIERAGIRRAGRKQLVGLRTRDPRLVLEEGAQLAERAGIPAPMKPIGHVTSSYASAALGHSIALAMVVAGRERVGQRLYVRMPGGDVEVEVTSPVFYDPEGARLHA